MPWQVTLYLDLTGPLGALAFAVNGAYQGVALELPRHLDCRGRHVPLLPHLLLRNMDVAVDFAGTSGAASVPVVHPRLCFRPWQVPASITDLQPRPPKGADSCGHLNSNNGSSAGAHVLRGSYCSNLYPLLGMVWLSPAPSSRRIATCACCEPLQTSQATVCIDARACAGCARRAWPRGCDGARCAATRVVVRGPHAGRPARRANTDLVCHLVHVRETLCLPPT